MSLGIIRTATRIWWKVQIVTSIKRGTNRKTSMKHLKPYLPQTDRKGSGYTKLMIWEFIGNILFAVQTANAVLQMLMLYYFVEIREICLGTALTAEQG